MVKKLLKYWVLILLFSMMAYILSNEKTTPSPHLLQLFHYHIIRLLDSYMAYIRSMTENPATPPPHAQSTRYTQPPFQYHIIKLLDSYMAYLFD